MVRILSIDTGPTTGFCLYDSEVARRCQDVRKGIVSIWHEWPGEFENPHQILWLALSTTSFDKVVCEKFEFRKDDQRRDKIDYLACELVGTVKTYCQVEDIPLVMQGSSLIGKTAFWSDDNAKVKQLGLYDPKYAPHGMDALRHLLYYHSFTLNQKEWFQRLK